MLSLLEDPAKFRIANKQAWNNAWNYWYQKEYIHQGIKEYVKEQMDAVKAEQGHLNILDIGCGSAWCAKYFLNSYDNYYGLDFNENLIQQLKTDLIEINNCQFYSHDIESIEPLPFSKTSFNFILGSFILLELTELKSFFYKAASVQEKGDYLIITGLDPLNEILRDSNSFNDVSINTQFYRQSDKPVLLAKNMCFENSDTELRYYRILYSINDIIEIAFQFGYTVCNVDDKLNKNSNSNSPIYYTVKLKL